MGDHMVVFKQFVESSKLLLNIILNPPKGQGYKTPRDTSQQTHVYIISKYSFSVSFSPIWGMSYNYIWLLSEHKNILIIITIIAAK